ncbi:glycoside hydrolase family 10 protein [Hyaloscypha variabilis]
MLSSTLVLPFLLPAAHAQLNTLAKAAGLKYFGTATDNPELTDTAYVAALSNTSDFGQITPGNSQKPSNGTFSFTAGDVITALAQKNDRLVRCHKPMNETLTAILKTNITTEVTHYKGEFYAWDVVSEALNDDATFRTDATAALNIIDGVGFQGHFIVGSSLSKASLVSNLEALTALGVEVALTELDIRMTLPSTTALLTQKCTEYGNAVAACVAANCVGVTVWDFDDKYSWVPSTFPGQGAACLFDEDLNRKPAYYGVVSALSGATQPAATGVAATATSSSSKSSTAAAVLSTSGLTTSYIALSTSAITSPNTSLTISPSASAAAVDPEDDDDDACEA